MKGIQVYVLLAILSLGFISASLISNETDDIQSGVPAFRDIYWGSPIDSTYRDGERVEFIRDKTSIAENAYIIQDDRYTIGNVKLNRVNYFFNDEDRFSKVILEGAKMDAEQMGFILSYKFGEPDNTSEYDEIRLQEWMIRDVTFRLAEFRTHKFRVTIESNWQAAEAYRRNTNVSDF